MKQGLALFANHADRSAKATRGSIAPKPMSDIANALIAGIRGPKSVNNLAQCTNGIVQASTKQPQAMQLFTHGISGISVGTNRRSY
jgi:hypothetical protein